MFDVGAGIKVGGSAKADFFANIIERERSYQSRNNTQTRSFQNFTYGAGYAPAYELNPRVEVAMIPGVNLNASGTDLFWILNAYLPFGKFFIKSASLLKPCT